MKLLSMVVFSGLNRQRSALRHGVPRVRCKVHQHLLDLARIGMDDQFSEAA